MAGDCLWDSEEHNVGDISHPFTEDLHRDKFNKELSVDMYIILCLTCLFVGPLGVLSHNDVRSSSA